MSEQNLQHISYRGITSSLYTHLHESVCYMQGNSKILGYKDLCVGEFPGGLVVGIPGSHCHGPGSVPGQGTEIQQAMWHNQEIKSKCTCVKRVYACALCRFSPVWLCVALWTIACQASLSMGFSRQGYWSRLPCPPARGSSQTRDWTQVSCIAGRFFTDWATWETQG